MYDHLHNAEHGRPPDFPDVSWKRVQTFCRAIKRRTGASAWYDRHSRRLHYGYTRPDGTFQLTALSSTLSEAVTGLVPDMELGSSEDQIVRLLQMGKLPAGVKDRWHKGREKAKAHEKRELLGRSVEAASRAADDAVEREYERYTMGKHYRRSTSFSGLKG